MEIGHTENKDISIKIKQKKEVMCNNKIMWKSIWQEDSQSHESNNDECKEEYHDYHIDDNDDNDDDDDHSSCPSDFDEWIK